MGKEWVTEKRGTRENALKKGLSTNYTNYTN